MDMFQTVQDTLDLCSVHDSSTSIDIVDRTVLLLQICSNLLDDAVRMFPCQHLGPRALCTNLSAVGALGDQVVAIGE